MKIFSRDDNFSDWILALLLAFPFQVGLLSVWQEPPTDSTAYFWHSALRLSFVLAALGVIRGLRFWRATDSDQRASTVRHWFQTQAPALAVYFPVLVVGLWMIFYIAALIPPRKLPDDITLMRALGTFLTYVVVYFVAQRASQTIAAKLTPLDSFDLLPLPRTSDGTLLVLRSTNYQLRPVVIVLLALCAVFIGAFLAVALVSRLAGQTPPSLSWSAVGAAVAFVPLIWLWLDSAPLGTISAELLHPRWQRAFAWPDVACIEARREFQHMDGEQIRELRFRGACGQLLWQLSLDEIHSDDRRALLAFFETGAPSSNLNARAQSP